MNKKQFRALEKLQVAMMMDIPVHQSKAKIYEELSDLGYCHKAKYRLRGALPIEVEGWEFTLIGHMKYCEECSKRVAI